MKFKLVSLLMVLMIVSSATLGCSVAEVASPPVIESTIYNLQTGGTQHVIFNVINNVPGARAFVNGDSILFASPMFKGWGFTCTNCTSIKDGLGLWKMLKTSRGYWTGADTFSAEIVPMLKKGGWKEITGATFADATLKVSVASATLSQKVAAVRAWLAGLTGSTGTVSIFVYPAYTILEGIPPELVGEKIDG